MQNMCQILCVQYVTAFVLLNGAQNRKLKTGFNMQLHLFELNGTATNYGFNFVKWN